MHKTPSKSLDAKIAYDLCIQWLGCLRVLFGTFGTLWYQRYLEVQKELLKENNGRMEAESIRPLIISANDTTAWFATKPWYQYLIYASVSARSRDARIPCIRYVRSLQVQEPNIPYTRYASVSATSWDACVYWMMIPLFGCKPSRGIFCPHDWQADGFGFHPPIVLFQTYLCYLKVSSIP